MKSHFADEERLRGREENSGEKRLLTNNKTKRGLKAWIPAGVYPREDGDGNDREERIRERRETSGAGREFMRKRLWTNTYYEVSLRRRRETSENGEGIHGEKDLGQIHIMKSHFADEERLRKTGREFGDGEPSAVPRPPPLFDSSCVCEIKI
jgi:hypothetical protein